MTVAAAIGLLLTLLSVSADAKTYKTKWVNNINIVSEGNVTLRADAFIPDPQESVGDFGNDTFPLLIFPNSWGMPQIEYILKALDFGTHGYVALEYETRGWYMSGGEIGTAGPLDRMDASNVLTWALKQKHWHIDETNVAFVGISYGAGIALQMAGYDKRLKTAVALSGWGDLTGGLYYQRSPNKVWAGLLVVLAELVGHPSKDVKQMMHNLAHHEHITETMQWAKDRSAITNISAINGRNIPLFLSNNMQDRIFFPQAQLHGWWNELTVPRFMLMNQGIHAEPEALGVIDVPHNYIWRRVMKWLDYWLKGEQNGIMSGPRFEIECGKTIFSGNYQKMTSWPSTSINHYRYYFSPRGTKAFGGLSKAPINDTASSDAVAYTSLPPLSVGIPVVSAALATLGLPTTVELLTANRQQSIIYRSDPLPAMMRLCGTPKINFTLSANSFAHGNQWQIYGFLYDVGLLDDGELISEVAVTNWAQTTSPVQHIRDANFRTVCQDVAQGHSLAVGFVLSNDLFYQANVSTGLTVNIEYQDGAIDLPWIEVP